MSKYSSEIDYFPFSEARLTECLLYWRMKPSIIKLILLGLDADERRVFFRRLKSLIRDRKTHFIKGRITGEEFLSLLRHRRFLGLHQRIAFLGSWRRIAGPLRNSERGPSKRTYSRYRRFLKSDSKIKKIVKMCFYLFILLTK